MNKFVLASLAAALCVASCTSAGNSSNQLDSDSFADTAAVVDSATPAADTAQTAEAEAADSEADIALIRQFYTKCVLTDMEGEPDVKWAKQHLTQSLLNKLQKAYDDEFGDEEGAAPGYAFWAFRTTEQDGSGASKITSITPEEDGCYLVSYTDMGRKGETKVFVKDGKIDNYKRIKG